MIRKSFLMKVYPDCEAEYERRHCHIWPELEKTLRDHGVSNYSIFIHPSTRQLFIYVEFDNEAQWNAVSRTPICRSWRVHMKELMPSNQDNSPVSEELREVFHIERL